MSDDFTDDADVDRAIGMCRSHGLHGTEKVILALQAENKALRDGRGVNTEAHCAKCGAPRSNHPYRHPFQWPVLRRGALSEGEG